MITTKKVALRRHGSRKTAASWWRPLLTLVVAVILVASVGGGDTDGGSGDGKDGGAVNSRGSGVGRRGAARGGVRLGAAGGVSPTVGFRRPRRMSTRHLLASHRSGNFCPYSVSKMVTCLVANGTETYQTRVAVGQGYQVMTMTRPRLITSYKEVKETNYGCCPGFHGDNCDTMCYNCTQIQDLESRVRTLESKLLRSPTGGIFNADEDSSEESLEEEDSANPLSRPIRMGRPDVSHVNGHPLNGGAKRNGGIYGARGKQGYRGRNGGRYGPGRGGGGRGGRRRFGGWGASGDPRSDIGIDEDGRVENSTRGRLPRPGFGPQRCSCPPGPPGKPGPPGAAGQDGREGLPGSPGVSGLPGSSGGSRGQDPSGGAPVRYIPGPPGPPGRNGRPGPVGIPGAPGPQGVVGLTGQDGLPGLRGSIGAGGPQGSPGPTGTSIPGPKGDRGFDGRPGDIGFSGPPGQPGEGQKGSHGEKGAAGVTGLSGSLGLPGLPGSIGPVGPRGLRGDIGPEGPVGPPGSPGTRSSSVGRGNQLEILDLTGPQYGGQFEGSGAGGLPVDDELPRGAPGPPGPPGPAGLPALSSDPSVLGTADVSLRGDNVRVMMDSLFNAVTALRENLNFIDARVSILENQLPKIREMTGHEGSGASSTDSVHSSSHYPTSSGPGYRDGHEQGIHYPGTHHSPTRLDPVTEEIIRATNELDSKVDEVTKIAESLPQGRATDTYGRDGSFKTDRRDRVNSGHRTSYSLPGRGGDEDGSVLVNNRGSSQGGHDGGYITHSGSDRSQSERGSRRHDIGEEGRRRHGTVDVHESRGEGFAQGGHGFTEGRYRFGHDRRGFGQDGQGYGVGGHSDYDFDQNGEDAGSGNGINQNSHTFDGGVSGNRGYGGIHGVTSTHGISTSGDDNRVGGNYGGRGSGRGYSDQEGVVTLAPSPDFFNSSDFSESDHYEYYYEEDKEDDEDYEDYEYDDEYSAGLRRKRQHSNVAAHSPASVQASVSTNADKNTINKQVTIKNSTHANVSSEQTIKDRLYSNNKMSNIVDVRDNTVNDHVKLRRDRTARHRTRTIRPGPPVIPSHLLNSTRVRNTNNYLKRTVSGNARDVGRLQMLKRLAKKWRAKKNAIQRSKRDTVEELTWI